MIICSGAQDDWPTPKGLLAYSTGKQMLRKGGRAMNTKVLVVLNWAERIAAAITIAIPAIRAIVSELDSAKAECARLYKGDE